MFDACPGPHYLSADPIVIHLLQIVSLQQSICVSEFYDTGVDEGGRKKMIHDRGQRPSGEVVRTNIHRVVDAKARQNLEVNP